jgi:hypothetical protein
MLSECTSTFQGLNNLCLKHRCDVMNTLHVRFTCPMQFHLGSFEWTTEHDNIITVTHLCSVYMKPAGSGGHSSFNTPGTLKLLSSGLWHHSLAGDYQPALWRIILSPFSALHWRQKQRVPLKHRCASARLHTHMSMHVWNDQHCEMWKPRISYSCCCQVV